jgi:hypothetical protein
MWGPVFECPVDPGSGSRNGSKHLVQSLSEKVVGGYFCGKICRNSAVSGGGGKSGIQSESDMISLAAPIRNTRRKNKPA